jgi:alpha-beta hydrolase superfamily lysophospholipase
MTNSQARALHERRYTGTIKHMDELSTGEAPAAVERREEWFSADDGCALLLRRWFPPEAAETDRAIVHIVHGMAEHSLRYDALARRLCREGYEVWAADQRGHGATADPARNDPAKGGLLGHCADQDGFSRVSADVHGINRRIKEISPRSPLFLLGHSWGSFIVQNCMERYGGELAGCVLSGTRGPDQGLKLRLGAPLLRAIAAAGGCRRPSRLAWALSDGPYRKAFKPSRTPFDWLSRDGAAVDAYIADPRCGMRCSSGFYRDLANGLTLIHRRESIARIRRDMPVYVFCGSADPVGDMGSSPTALVEAYRAAGIADLEFVLYPEARHETLHETNRDEVSDGLIAWLNKRRGT